MCGIFGVITKGGNLSGKEIERAIEKLFLFSETRGKEASGFAVKAGSSIKVHKAAQGAAQMMSSEMYSKYVEHSIRDFKQSQSAFAMIGHTRLATNGIQAIPNNNQPVACSGCVAIHNGIIVNVEDLWESYPQLARTSQVDTELIPALFAHFSEQGQTIDEAVRSVFDECKGAISTAMLLDEYDVVLLATNTGSLYTVTSNDGKSLYFASERVMLSKLSEDAQLNISKQAISHIEPGRGQVVEIDKLRTTDFPLDSSPRSFSISIPKLKVDIIESDKERSELRDNIKRCTRCILPETMPFITFDEEGVCNYCHSHSPIETRPENDFLSALERHRSPAADGDCILAFSGGRDSSYALHYMCEEMGVRPVAYSYDWGMITDLARRNQARLTGALGVEHVIISADIGKKRKNINKNLMAWLKKPHLGMLPILMAGDKHFFYYANVLQKQMGIRSCVWSPNHFERTQFKLGFAGINTVAEKKQSRLSAVSIGNKAKLAGFYASQNATNPLYLNSSYLDTIAAFLSYYVIKKEYLYFFDYVPWNENTVDKVLIDTYDWETAADAESTWRIGDGTAAFYNLAYYMVAGFTENDTFRSNQIREGHLTRDKALKLARRDNQPRYDSIIEYLNTVNVDANYAIKTVMDMPTLYGYPEML